LKIGIHFFQFFSAQTKDCKQGRNEGGQGGTISRAPSHYGAPNGCGGRQKVPSMSQIFFDTVDLLPKQLSFEHGGAKLASCPGRCRTSLRPWFQV